ncbi:O-antigen ligase domain-containing protein [Coleofasciculus sp. F4-SAH-05]|uniref:O-antigen ligase domain-containing protein n=1 Tax=Coleofasciculus sp. F4-SAH-05 TaxID=3069525 RepID=UPI0032F97949
MTPQAQLAMLAWIPVVLFLFVRFPAQKAVIIGFIGAWLFLPQKAGFYFPGLPDYDRVSAVSYSILLATFVFDVGRFRSFKFSWIDIPMLIWCLCPLASSITSGLGAYDGMSAVLDQTIAWGVPYFLGRIYLNNLRGLRLLAIGIFIGGLVYVPLCLFEIRMSPQLHQMVYGYFPHMFAQTIRYGGFRPQVFMTHGLQVGIWMMSASLIGIWLWQAGVIKQLWGIPMSWLVLVLSITFVLLKSTGAWFLMALGVAILFSAKWFRTALPFFLTIVIIFSYLYGGVTGEFTGEKKDGILQFVTTLTDESRAGSLGARFNQEEVLGDLARERIVFGHGKWGWVARDEETGKEYVAADSLWILGFTHNGVVGLFSLYLAMLLPVISFGVLRYPGTTWFHPKVAPAAALAVVVMLFMFDSLLNAHPTPTYMLASGAISGLVVNETQTQKVKGNRAAARRSLAQKRQHQHN